MTFVNRLIREAKDGATELLINDRQVSKIAQHYLDLCMTSNPPDKAVIERRIRAGELKMCGLPIRVVGRAAK